MSDGAGFKVSVKDYAAQRGKTIQAVYQQMKRKENAAALEGHITLLRVGNRNVKYLDEEAVAILDHSSNSAPLTLLEDGMRDKLSAVENEKEKWKAQAFKLQGKVELLTDLVEKKEGELRLLGDPQKRIDEQKAEIDRLKAEIEAEKARAEEAEKKAQEAEKRADEANSRTFGDYLKTMLKKKEK